MRRTITSAILLSSLVLSAAAFASPPTGDSPAPTRRVSTGITAPRLLDSLALNASPSVTPNIPEGTQITVSFVVDGNGQPRDIHVVQGYNMVWNALAIDAVSRLHYRPAMLDNQPIAMNMNLVITLAR